MKDTNNFIEIPEGGIGNVSDGYHTFNELYHHRAVLFSVICNVFSDKAWKSKKHHEGDMFEGMFIVGIDTPEGQATYHYDIDPYWDMFNVKELDIAPWWDGHSAEDAIERIKSLNTLVMRKSSEWIPCGDGEHTPLMCTSCGQSWPFYKKRGSKFCPNCGAYMKSS